MEKRPFKVLVCSVVKIYIAHPPPPLAVKVIANLFIAHLCWGRGTAWLFEREGRVFLTRSKRRNLPKIRAFKKFGQFFLVRQTDRQTDIVVHREVTLPKNSLVHTFFIILISFREITHKKSFFIGWTTKVRVPTHFS